jgi:REP element-mobilizing transposase RayT
VPRRPRSSLDDEGIFHVTALGVGGCLIYEDDRDRLDFTDLFWAAALEFEWECCVLCLMGTHYHAVVKACREQLSLGMHKVNGSYARRFNLRRGRRGHLFEARFSSWVMEDERHLEATIAYVVWNPVRANLCDLPDEWEWTWLEPSRAANSHPALARSASSDCPMGQSLRRARERRRRRRLKGRSEPGRIRPVSTATAETLGGTSFRRV